jgi:nucleotide-binding universal stress UspA family protein
VNVNKAPPRAPRGGIVKHILVPCDGSDNAMRAVAHAVATARESTAHPDITLLHVLDPMTFASLGETLSPGALERGRPAEVDRALGPAEHALRDAGVPYRVAWRVGDPAPEIAAELADKPYDAVVMGTRGLGPVANLVMGSVANRVQYLADVPLTLIK